MDRFEEAALNHAAHAAAKRAQRAEVEATRHRPGTAYSCDARHFGADKRLCPMHKAAPDALRTILELAEARSMSAADRIAAIHFAAKNCLDKA